MNSLIKSLLVVCFVLSSVVLAQPAGEIIIRTRDGKTHQGRVLSETAKGYLLAGPRGASVIEFASIVDLQKVEAQEPAAQNPAAQNPAVVAAPLAPPPPPAQLVASPPPPPPARAVDEVIAESTPKSRKREGFHFGVGASLGLSNAGPSAFAHGHFDFNFGWPALRLGLNVGTYSNWIGTMINPSVDSLFHFNIGRVFSLGAGVQLGVTFGEGYFFTYLAPVIQPVIIKLGEGGQHQISLTGSIVALSSLDRHHDFDEASIEGTIQITAGYSFFF